MNFLAHTYLSFESPLLIVGNYLGDFIRNKEVTRLPLGVQAGVQLHRSIDSFTDNHPAVKEGTALLHHSMRKYAPVVLDIYCDYLLSKRWQDFNDKTLSEYCVIPYQALLDHQFLMTERISNRMQKMVASHWLENYQTYDGMQRVFNFLAMRASFPSNLLKAPAILKEKENVLEELFMVFFPDIINHCLEVIDNLNAEATS